VTAAAEIWSGILKKLRARRRSDFYYNRREFFDFYPIFLQEK